MEQEIVAEHNAMEVDVDMENLAEAITQEERKAPVPQRGDTGSSFKSTGTTDTSVSHFSPRTVASEDDEDDADNIQRLAPTKPERMDKYFLVQGKKLLELFRLSRCGCPNDDEPGTVQLEEEGSAPIITYLTKGDRLRKRRWSGQEKIGSRPNDKRLTGNAKICVAAATTGLRITVIMLEISEFWMSLLFLQRLLKWAEETNVALPSRSAFYDVFKALRPSIAQVYERHQNDVIQIIRNAYEVIMTSGEAEREEQLHGWDIAVDGAFDSRGFSADFCKVLAVDLKTNLCIYTELVHRSETAGVSGRMEKEGFHRLLRWFRSRSIEINSISTDRSTVYGTEIRQFNAEFNTDIKWFLDPWHLARNLYKKLRTAAKRTGCEDLRQWIDPLKAHLYDAVRKGAAAKNGDLIRQTFNSCLFHVADIHEWVEDATTGPVTKCGHKPLTGQRDKPALPTGSIPHDTLKAIVLNPVFQKDLTMTSHLGGTRQCEAKNSLDRLYCPKELFLPASTYNFYVKLSTLHKNALTLAEMRGERTVKREFDVTRKFNDRESHMVEKTAIEHVWRREIYVHYTTNNYPQPETEEALNER
ncbi:unnamed protein product [Cylicocyclus nassatus]|uniref:Transposase n=1 Tax=Cylicocyclus nassatus TaxID=53992 RepID=A0AA36GGR5_CYLNA|nr:unnamed protein product [Cylicocyclus nassatus]